MDDLIFRRDAIKAIECASCLQSKGLALSLARDNVSTIPSVKISVKDETCDKGKIEIDGNLLEVSKEEVKFLTTTFFCDTITDASGHVWQRVEDK